MIDDRTAHELAAKLHNANGRIARATRPSQTNSLGDARTIIADVIADLVCSESVESRMAHHKMPVIPRDDNPPTDPSIPSEATWRKRVADATELPAQRWEDSTHLRARALVAKINEETRAS